ncbi:MAG: hypothetical protein KatS3mg102_2662 [Planctomycetota bacterium]|nr:MAG: hypothetical protein KatS3mg102_2662 [Planctomycetota bacterium]
MSGAGFAGGGRGAAPARFRAPGPAPAGASGRRQVPRRVVIANPNRGLGGAEATTLWAAQALVDGCRVALLAPRWVELAACDAFYGTALAERGLGVCNGSVPAVLFRRAGFLWRALFERHCRRLAPRFDVHVSAYNWMDFGLPAVHCIADFSWDWELQRLAGSRPGRPRWLQSAYLAACRVLAGLPPARSPAETGLLVANSEYTAELLRRRFGLEELPVLYPPVGAPLVEPLPWHAREPGLVCLGRISPEKRLERAIEIVRRLRARGHRVRLHLVGKMVETPYGRAIRRLCERERDWVVVHGELVGAAKWELLGRQRFGIHARDDEPFGIAVGELARGGVRELRAGTRWGGGDRGRAAAARLPRHRRCGRQDRAGAGRRAAAARALRAAPAEGRAVFGRAVHARVRRDRLGLRRQPGRGAWRPTAGGAGGLRCVCGAGAAGGAGEPL